MKRSVFFIITAVLIFGIFVFFTLYIFSALTTQSNKTEYVLKVPPGTTVRAVAAELKKQNLIRSKTAFYIAARISGFMLKSGRFIVSSDMNTAQIFESLKSNNQVPIKVSLREGLTITQIAHILEKNDVTNAEAFISACSDTLILEKYKIPSQTAEGYLFPDTYFFDPEMKANSVVTLMLDTFFKHIQEIPQLKNSAPKQLFESVILASIVEREYRLPQEAPLMASVFKNRLKHNIGLESCATIVYILTEQQGKPHPETISYADLKIDSEYNTYKWAGLPPGPISNPGVTALQAVANTPETDYYYFRLTDAAKGTHVFTKSLAEHSQAGQIIKTKDYAAN